MAPWRHALSELLHARQLSFFFKSSTVNYFSVYLDDELIIWKIIFNTDRSNHSRFGGALTKVTSEPTRTRVTLASTWIHYCPQYKIILRQKISEPLIFSMKEDPPVIVDLPSVGDRKARVHQRPVTWGPFHNCTCRTIRNLWPREDTVLSPSFKNSNIHTHNHHLLVRITICFSQILWSWSIATLKST